MTRHFSFGFYFGFFVLTLLALSSFSPVSAEVRWAPNLEAIGYPQVLADSRFAGLTGGFGQSIAILDTGIDPGHSFFSDGLNDSRVTGGKNFADDEPDHALEFADNNNHGTFVASVAATSSFFYLSSSQELEIDSRVFEADEEFRYEGLASGSSLIAVRVLDSDGRGSFADVHDGLKWVLDNYVEYNIRAVNLSLGTTDTFLSADDLEDDPLAQDFQNTVEDLKHLNIPVIAAAGNTDDEEGLAFPAILENVISVGASQFDPDEPESEILTDFTNRGDGLDLLAPGFELIGALAELAEGEKDQIAIGSGTSFAAPQVAAALLLINEVFENRWGRKPNYQEQFDFLTASNTMIEDPVTGKSYPRLDLHSALNMAFVVPEPSTLLLLAAASLIFLKRQRKF